MLGAESLLGAPVPLPPTPSCQGVECLLVAALPSLPGSLILLRLKLLSKLVLPYVLLHPFMVHLPSHILSSLPSLPGPLMLLRLKLLSQLILPHVLLHPFMLHLPSHILSSLPSLPGQLMLLRLKLLSQLILPHVLLHADLLISSWVLDCAALCLHICIPCVRGAAPIVVLCSTRPIPIPTLPLVWRLRCPHGVHLFVYT